MSTPQRIQLSRAKGWRMPANTIKVDRSTRWGNPYSAWRDQSEQQWYCSNDRCHWPVASREEGIELAVKKHAEDCERSAGFYGAATILAELRGKNLACWCKPGAPCHADTLLRLANGQANQLPERRQAASVEPAEALKSDEQEISTLETPAGPVLLKTPWRLPT